MVHRLDITARLQRRMLEIAATALPLITKMRDDADLVGLAHLRREMVDAIEAYSGHVVALRDQGGLPAGDAAAMAICCQDLQAAYEAFRARWTHRNWMEHWHEYRLSAVVMIKQVRSLVQAAEAATGGVPHAARSTPSSAVGTAAI